MLIIIYHSINNEVDRVGMVFQVTMIRNCVEKGTKSEMSFSFIYGSGIISKIYGVFNWV